jgi:hypothetical protein
MLRLAMSVNRLVALVEALRLLPLRHGAEKPSHGATVPEMLCKSGDQDAPYVRGLTG